MKTTTETKKETIKQFSFKQNSNIITMNTNTNNMNANNDDTAASNPHQAGGGAGAPAQDIRRQLESMIDAEDWTRIKKFIREQQEEQQHGQRQMQLQHTADTNSTNATSTTSSTPNGTLLEEVVNILTSKDRLPYTLLQQKKSESAKELLLMLVTLGGNDYVMRKDFYYEEERYGFGIYGTLLHVAIRWNSCMEVVSRIIKVGGGRDIVIHAWTENLARCGRAY